MLNYLLGFRNGRLDRILGLNLDIARIAPNTSYALGYRRAQEGVGGWGRSKDCRTVQRPVLSTRTIVNSVP